MIDSSTIYRVSGYYASGFYATHHVGAPDVHTAIASVLAADNRIIRITSAKPVNL